MILIVPLIYLCGNGYLFLRTWQTMSGLPIWVKISVSVLFWAVVFSLFVAIIFREAQIPDWISRMMFNAGSIWLVFLLYMVLTLAVFDIAKIFFSIPGSSLWYAMSITCGLLTYGYINYKNPKIEHIDITLDKAIDRNSIKLVAVSDIHLGYGTGLSSLTDYVELINAQKPDVVVISGDLIDNSLRPIIGKGYDTVLSSIEAPLGIYTVPGNHEYISGIDDCAGFLKSTSITLLQDSITTLPGGIQLIGRDDRSNKRRKPLADLLKSADYNRPIVVLDHQPYHLAESDSLGVDIQISGHTHQGQVWPLNLVTDHLYEQSHGYHKWSHAHVWVSSGLSLWGPPFRIGTRSDLAVITITGRG